MRWSSVVVGRRAGVAVFVTAVALAGIGTAGASGARCTGSGTGSPNVGPGDNWLQGVAVTSACNGWAVGFYSNRKHTVLRTLIEHWNGRTWRVQSSPSPSGSDNELTSVAATSAKNAWAVGSYSNSKGEVQTLVEHWDGKAWKVQPSPNAGSLPNGQFFGVAATSASNAWAVGHYFERGVARTLIEHWNGKAWKLQPTPRLRQPGNNKDLRAVAASSPSNAWAVGKYFDGSAERTLIEHWNGAAWKLQPSPDVGSAGNSPELEGVAASSATRAWAVGDLFNGTAFHAFVERWNGRAWKLQPSPHRTSSYLLDAVAATSSKNAWAVGDNAGRTFIEHFDGSAWKVQPSAGSEHGNLLSAVAAISPTDAWAVGFDFNKAFVRRTLIEHFNGRTWTR